MGNCQALLRFFGIAAAAAMAALTGTAQVASGQAISAGGGAGTAPAARQVFMRAVPNASAANLTAFRAIRRPLTGMPKSTYEALKAQAASPHGVALPITMTGKPQPQPAPRSGRETPTAIVNFDGDAEFEACSFDTPADQALAIGDGKNPILQVVNVCLSVWNSAGTRLLGPIDLVSFFGLPAGTFTSDPRALYDWYNHRFIVTLLDTSCPNGGCTTSTNNYNIAVSQSDDPTALWFTYRMPVQSAANAIHDFPRVGQDRAATYPITSGTPFPGAIYLAANLFDNNSGAYLKEEWLILPKAAMYNGQKGFSFWQFNGMTSGGVVTDSTQPVNVGSPYDNPRAEFLITSKDFFCSTGCNGLTIWAISNPFGFVTGGPSPELSSVVIGTVNNYSQPPGAVQPGTSTLIDTNDTRISGEATYQSGSIYASNESANGAGGVASLIYRVQPDLNVNDNTRCTGSFQNLCPQITGATELNESVINNGGTSAVYFAVPQPDLEGNVNTVFTYSRHIDLCKPCLYFAARDAGEQYPRYRRVIPPGGVGPRIYPGPLGRLQCRCPRRSFLRFRQRRLSGNTGLRLLRHVCLRQHLAHQNRVQQVQRAWPAVSAVRENLSRLWSRGRNREGISSAGAASRSEERCRAR